ncbi:hypothetical protein Tco_0543779 [Tanacetum coccineum]
MSTSSLAVIRLSIYGGLFACGLMLIYLPSLPATIGYDGSMIEELQKILKTVSTLQPGCIARALDEKEREEGNL